MTKTILITGATAGFGQAAARRFAADGWCVIGTGRRAERLQELQQELGDAFLPLEIDMRDREAVESLSKLSPPWGDIDLLLNNAGIQYRGRSIEALCGILPAASRARAISRDVHLLYTAFTPLSVPLISQH